MKLNQTIFELKAYFCPKCGLGHESHESRINKNELPLQLTCTHCKDVKIVYSGFLFIIIGALIWLLSSLILGLSDNHIIPTVTSIVFCIFGVFRVIKEIILKKKGKPNIHEAR